MTMTSFSAGVNTSFSSQLNSNFKQVLLPVTSLDATDNTAVTNNTTSYVTGRTKVFSAGSTMNYILIRGDLCAEWTAAGYSNSATTTASLELKTDSTQRFEISTTRAIDYSGGFAGVETGVPCRGFAFIYTPSAGEKSAGFTLTLNLKRTVSGTSFAGNATNNYWEVYEG